MKSSIWLQDLTRDGPNLLLSAHLVVTLPYSIGVPSIFYYAMC
jgi:hypothetical protein